MAESKDGDGVHAVNGTETSAVKGRLPRFWNCLSLRAQFLAIASVVVCGSMLILGQWLNSQIVAGQIRSRAESVSVYMKAFLAPHVRQLGDSFEISEANFAQLDRFFLEPEMAERVEGVRIWRRDGTIVYSTDRSLVGKRVLNAEVASAFTGKIVAQLESKPDEEDGAVRSYPLLETYAPIYRDKENRVIAVGEFYEEARDFIDIMAATTRRSWLIVGTTTSAMMALLYHIIARANRLLESQQAAMVRQIASANELAIQNGFLSETADQIRIASSKASERLLNRIGSDLHDGPVQLLTLLILGFRQTSRKAQRSKVKNTPTGGGDSAEQESLARQVLTELRDLSMGLILPDIEGADFESTLRLAVQRHEKTTATSVATSFRNLAVDIDPALKICCFRVVQEGLNNAFRHGQGRGQQLLVDIDGDKISIWVKDSGPGPNNSTKDPSRAHPLGLQGIRNRVEAFGGTVELKKGSPQGAELFVELPMRSIQQ